MKQSVTLAVVSAVLAIALPSAAAVYRGECSNAYTARSGHFRFIGRRWFHRRLRLPPLTRPIVGTAETPSIVRQNMPPVGSTPPRAGDFSRPGIHLPVIMSL